MHAAILLPPPAEALDTLPPGFATMLGPEALREWLARPSAATRVVAVSPGQRFEHAVTAALGLTGDANDVAIVYVAGHDVVSRVEWAELGFDAKLLEAETRADEDVESSIAVASGHFDQGSWDSARAAYRAADERLGHETSPRHAEVLTCLGEIERGSGRNAEAAALFDRALAIFPRHRGALRGRATLARSSGECAVAAALLHRLVPGANDDDERVDLLATIATESLAAARDAMVHALGLRPGDRSLLERLRAVHEAAGEWNDAVGVMVALAETLHDKKERARMLVLAAETCAGKVGNIPRAVALYEAAIEDDARVAGAFAAIEQVLLGAGDYPGVANAYQRQLERLSGTDADSEREALLSRLGDVRQHQLGDPMGAIAALDQVVCSRPDDVEVRARLANLLVSVGQAALAVRCLELAADHAPARAETYRSLYGLFKQSADDDRAYGASAVLVALGEADLDEQLAYAQFAPESALKPTRAFDDAVWDALLPADHDRDLDRLLALVADAALRVWLDERKGKLPEPDEKLRQDPVTTTVSAVRSVAWTARLLGVPEPAIYTQPAEARVSVATLPGRSGAVLLGRSTLTGRSVVELSFMMAHHLSYLRGGWRVGAYYPDIAELGALARAAVSLVRPETDAASSASGTVTRLAQAIGSRLDRGRYDALGPAVSALTSRAQGLDLKAWRRGVEIAACRAGLLACGDVTVAGNLLATAGGHVAGLTAADRVRDLYAFTVSTVHAQLRDYLGVAQRS